MSQWNHLDRVLDRFVEDGVLTGCGMQIIYDGQMVYNRCAGAATVDGTRPFTEDTGLRMHSMSKTFTCAGLMTLYEKGLFTLNDPVAEYLPEFSNPMVCVSDTDINDVVPAKTPITIRQLLSMTSGLTYWGFWPGQGLIEDDILASVKEIAEEVKNGKPYELADFVKLIARKPLCFQPGERWHYGLSHTVAGRLIEVLSGKRLSEYMRETIWEPLELERTCFSNSVPDPGEIADLTVSQELCGVLGLEVGKDVFPAASGKAYGSRRDVLPGTNLGIELPCGGMISTLHDLGRYYSMFANGGSWNGTRILSRRTIDLMRANQLTPDQLPDFTQMINRGFGYGLGYRTMLHPETAGFYLPEGTFGWDGACGCFGAANPDHRLAFVFAEQSLPHHIDYTIPRVVAAMNADMEI